MELFAVEKGVDDNTGLECWFVVNTNTGIVIDRAFDRESAVEIAEYYQDMETDPYEYDDDPGEFQEWMDFDPDC